LPFLTVCMMIEAMPSPLWSASLKLKMPAVPAKPLIWTMASAPSAAVLVVAPRSVKISDSVYLCQVYEPTKSVPRGGPPQAGHTIPGITIGTVTLDPGQGANISIGP